MIFITFYNLQSFDHCSPDEFSAITNRVFCLAPSRLVCFGAKIGLKLSIFVFVAIDPETKQKGLLMLASGKAVKDIAAELKISTKTVTRWKSDPQFQGYVKKATLEACDTGIAKFASLFNTAAAKIEQIMNDPKAPQRLQLEAAKMIINYALECRRQQVEELKAIEILVASGYLSSEILDVAGKSIDEMSGKIMLAIKNGNGDNNDGNDIDRN